MVVLVDSGVDDQARWESIWFFATLIRSTFKRKHGLARMLVEVQSHWPRSAVISLTPIRWHLASY